MSITSRLIRCCRVTNPADRPRTSAPARRQPNLNGLLHIASATSAPTRDRTRLRAVLYCSNLRVQSDVYPQCDVYVTLKKSNFHGLK